MPTETCTTSFRKSLALLWLGGCLFFVGTDPSVGQSIAPTQQSGYTNSPSSQANGSVYRGAQGAVGNRAQQRGVATTPQQRAAMEQAAREAQYNAQLLREAQAKSIPEPQRPFPELSPEETKYLHQLLDFWESSSKQVKQYKCKFRRFEYNTAQVNWRDPKTNLLAAYSIAIGEIRFAAPDKASYETTGIWDFKAPPAQPGGEAQYEIRTAKKGPDEQGPGERLKEKWICDGRNVYEFDYVNKRLYETEIPEEMRGSGMVNSPIPFIFGAKKEDILKRFWIRPIPKDVDNEYWLEAYPKRVEDARMYSRLEIVISRDDFQPKALHMYSPQYNPAKNNLESRYFAFEDRKVNNRLDRLSDFFKHFIRPQTPITGGWTRVQRSALEVQQAELPPRAAGTNPPPQTGLPRR